MITDSPLPGLKIIQLKSHEDNRGFFIEYFNKKTFSDLGLPLEYFQDNYSFSLPRVLRGLHYQENPSQAKFITCTRGQIYDVTVDIRKNSPTFGQHFGYELSASNAQALLIPAGFAHGFCVIGDEPAEVFYKVDNAYNKESESGIIYNDESLGIKWPIKNPIISQKDSQLKKFSEYKKNPVF